MHPSRSRLVAAIVASSVLLLVCGPARAQDDERRVDEMRQRLEQLMHQADELADAGRHDRADAVRREAEAVRARLEATIARHAHRSDDHAKVVEQIERLEHGMAALRELGRHDELERLERIAADLRRRLEARERRPEDEHPERAAARRQLEVMRLALGALREAERPDAADLMERAVRALEMHLEGRDDAEARSIRAHAPNPAQQAELLLFAEGVLRELGAEEKAAAVGRLGRALAERVHREHAEPPHEPGPRDAQPPHEPPQQLERVMHRVELLEERLGRLEQRIERLQATIQKLHHPE